MLQLIVDTNVVLSALLATHGQSPSYRIVRAAMAGAFGVVVSSALMTEYRDVLGRADVARRHKQTPVLIGTFLDELTRDARHVNPPATPLRAPDVADQHLWDLLDFVPEAVLVTGDRKLLDASEFQGAIQSPREFADRYGL